MVHLKLLLALSLSCEALGAITGLYDIKMSRIGNCADMGTGQYTTNLVMTKRSTHKAVFTGNLTYNLDMDENLSGDWNISLWRSGGWGRNLFYDHSDDYCRGLKRKLPEMWNLLYSAAGVSPLECPIKAGTYMINNLDADLPRMHLLPLLPYGKFQIINSFYHGKPPKKVGCAEFYVNVSERPKA